MTKLKVYKIIKAHCTFVGRIYLFPYQFLEHLIFFANKNLIQSDKEKKNKARKKIGLRPRRDSNS